MSTPLVPRTVNPKAILVLAAGAIVFGVTVHFVHGYQVKRNARDLLEQAGQVEQEDHLDQAVDALSQYLGMVPSDTDALARYGLLLDKLARNGRAKLRALLVLNQVLNRDRERADVRRQAARIALEVGWFKDAKIHLEILLKESNPDAELLRLLARSEAGGRDFEKAAEQYARAIQLAPRDAELCQEYALLLRGRLDRPYVADNVMEGLIAQDRRAVPARLAAARYYVHFSAVEKAEVHLRFLLTELAVEDADVLLLAAGVAQAQGKVDEARAHLERGVQRHPHDPRLSYEMARLALRAGERDKAVRLLETRFQELPNDSEELEKLANLLLDAKEQDRARTVIARLRENGAAPVADYLEARALMHQGDYGKARALLEKVGKDSPRLSERGRRAELLLAECHRRLGNPDERLRACRRALEGNSRWLPGRRALAAALTDIGKLDEAIREYRGMVSELPEVRGELANLLIVSTLRAPAAARDWKEVQTLAQEMAKDKQRAGEAKLLEMRLLLAQDRLSQARTVLEAERERDPKQVAPWLLLVRLAEREGRKTTILPLLDQAERQTGKRAEWELMRMRYWISLAPAQARWELTKIEERLGQYPESEQDQIRTSLASAYGSAGAPEAAERLWRQLAERQPHNLDARFLLLERALQTDKEKEAERLLDEMRNLEGGRGAYTVYGEAARHVLRVRHGDKEGLAEARHCLRQAAGLRPSWSRVPLLEATLDELEKRPDKALGHYQAAMNLGENRLSIVRRVLELLSRESRYAEANAMLHKLPEAALASPELGRVAASLTLVDAEAETGRDAELARARALELARKAVGTDSKNPRDYLWLGQVAALSGQPHEAEKAFRRARQLAESDPETWVTLILFLARTDAQQAAAELAEAERKLPKDQAGPALGTCCEALGQLEQAEKHYQAALAAKPGDSAVLRGAAGFFDRRGQRDKAEELLRRLMATETKAPEETIAWARRVLALSLSRNGTYQRFGEALALLDAGEKERTPELEDRLTRALVLATRPAHRRDALRLFESLTPAQVAARPDFRLLFAALYEDDGNWPKAREHLRALVAAHDKNPLYLAAYVRAMLEHKQTEEAATWVDRLAALRPGVFPTIELKARVAHANGRTEEAVKGVRAFAQEKDAPLDRVAYLFEQIGRPAEAEAAYRQFAAASKEPRAVLPLAVHLARQRRVPEALDLCERAWDKCPPEVVGRACVVAIRAGQGDEQQQGRVERLLRSAQKAHPRLLSLTVLLADLKLYAGRHEEVATLYRDILRQDSRNIVALNNLALVTALALDQPTEALKWINAALEQAGPHAELLDTRAMVYLRSGQSGPALEDLKSALAQTPSAAKYFHLAQAYHLMGDREQTQRAFQQAERMGLKADTLSSLEGPAYQQLAKALAKK